MHDVPGALEQHYQPRHLQPAGGGTAAASHDHQQDEDALAELRPEVEVRGHEARGGHRAHLEGGEAQGIAGGIAQFQHQDIFDYAPDCTAARDYDDFITELLNNDNEE